MRALRRDFLPSDLEPILAKHGFDGCVAVQADQSEAETHFLLGLAAERPFVRGVVGWVDLLAADLSARLDHFSQFPALRGFRHILQAEEPTFMLQATFLHGLRELVRRGYAYDILVFPRHLSAVRILLKQVENQAFVIDHLAKPYIRRGLWRQWAKDLQAIARHENVFCKISGMTTEADWTGWRAADFAPYLDIALEAFGAERLMYGSDWPVCLLASDYAQQLAAAEGFLAKLSASEQAKIMGENAARFYKIH